MCVCDRGVYLKKYNDNGKVKSEKLLGLFVRVSKVEIFEMLP